MFELFCREWNSMRVRFWSVGYKKRLCMLILLLFIVGCFVAWNTLFADLSDLKITQQERHDGINESSLWDKWVVANGFKSIGDIWDDCEPSDTRKMIGKVIIHYDSEEKRVIGTAVANFSAKVAVNSGIVHVVAQFHGRTLHDVKHKICKVDAKTFGCPIHKGQKMNIYETFKLPKYIPKGNYFATAKLLNEDGICLGMTESNIII